MEPTFRVGDFYSLVAGQDGKLLIIEKGGDLSV